MKYLIALLFCFTLAAQQTVNNFTVKTNLIVGGQIVVNNIDVSKNGFGIGNPSSGNNRKPYFFDDFCRPNTTNGNIGLPVIGTAYDLRGNGAVVPSSVTRIESQKWVADPGDIVYGVQELTSNVSRVGMQFRFIDNSPGTNTTGSLAILIVPDKTGAQLINNCGLHFVVTRTQYSVEVRTNSTSYVIAGGSGVFPTPLSFNTPYSVDISISGNYVQCNIAGVSVSVSDSRVGQYSGRYVAWEHYLPVSNVAWKTQIESVWAESSPQTSTSYQNIAQSFKATGGALSYYVGDALLAGTSSSFNNIYGGSSGLVLYDSSANAGIGVYSGYVTSEKNHIFNNGINLGTSLFANRSSGYNNIYSGTNGLSVYDSSANLLFAAFPTYLNSIKNHYFTGAQYLGASLFSQYSSGYNQIYGGGSGLLLNDQLGVQAVGIQTNYINFEKETYINNSVGFYVKIQVKEGSNRRMGTATLTAGSATVSTTAVAANSRIYLTSNTDGGTPGWLRVSTRTAGTSFTIQSSSGTDTSTVAWIIFDPAP